MCFSASASFIASGGLAVAGVVALKTAPKKQKLIALIPLLFAIQQAAEGFQWLAIRAGAMSILAGYVFLFFALFVWPIYIPMAVYILDRRSHRAIRWLMGLGTGVGVYLGWVLLTHPLTIGRFGQCIDYRIDVPFLLPVTLLYILVVSGAPLFSKRRAFKIFGAATLVSGLIAAIFFFGAFTSVWCLFAAILSVLILFYIERG